MSRKIMFPPVVVPAPLPSPTFSAPGDWMVLSALGDFLASPTHRNFNQSSESGSGFFSNPTWSFQQDAEEEDYGFILATVGGGICTGAGDLVTLPPTVNDNQASGCGVVTPQTYSPFANAAELTSIAPAPGALKRAVRLLKDSSASAQLPNAKRTRRLSSTSDLMVSKSDSRRRPTTRRISDKFDNESKTDSASSVSGTFTGLAAGTNGENRLRIKFESFGKKSSNLQRYGKNGCFIPDGLRGAHEMYDQLWRFEVVYHQDQPKAIVRLIWRITNIASGLHVELMETPQQVARREESGRTICNKVVKMAMGARAQELEAVYRAKSDSMDQAERASLENSIRVLRPRLCTVGLLFFGLLHDAVQIHLQ